MIDWSAIDLSYSGIDEIDTPALIIDETTVNFNIQQAIEHAGGVHRLRPHVKTHKILEVARMQRAAGIKNFKCATIPEAEMLGMAGADDVLIAYQPHGPKIQRVADLIAKFPKTNFQVLLDNVHSAHAVNEVFSEQKALSVYIDINDGQNRSGIRPTNVEDLVDKMSSFKSINIVGLHCYDGHIRMSSLEERIDASKNAFREVIALRDTLQKTLGKSLNLVAGGSPSFTVHARYHHAECSPGTFIFWDQRYYEDYRELPFERAAVVATRVLSKVDPYTYCLDLGHKSIASEFPFPRVKLLTDLNLTQIGHSEEHLVVKSEQPDVLLPGQLLLGIPYHICPTVALYDRVHVMKNGRISHQWKVIARDRKITC